MNKQEFQKQRVEIDYEKKITNNANSELKTFGAFFDSFKSFYQEVHEKPIIIPTTETFNKFFIAFDALYEPFFASGATINVWQEAQLKCNELRNCSVLKWLLDCKGSHGQGDMFFKAILAHLGIALNIASGYRTQLELSYTFDEDSDNIGKDGSNTKKYNRVDIVMQNAHFLLFLEVKINAPEGTNQLQRYSDTLASHRGSRDGVLIYLTPRHNYLPKTIKSLQSKPEPLSWRQVANAFEKALPEEIQKQNAMQRPLWASLVQQFCEHIRNFNNRR